MSKTVSRILWVVAGVLLMAAGVICLAWPGVALTTLAVYARLWLVFGGWDSHRDFGAFRPIQPGLYHAHLALYFRYVAPFLRYFQDRQLL